MTTEGILREIVGNMYYEIFNSLRDLESMVNKMTELDEDVALEEIVFMRNYLEESVKMLSERIKEAKNDKKWTKKGRRVFRTSAL